MRRRSVAWARKEVALGGVVVRRRCPVILGVALSLLLTVAAGPALAAPTTVRVSVDLGGGDPDGPSLENSISANGRYVAFDSLASDLVAEDGNDLYDVFVRDLVTGTTVRASVDAAGGDPDGGSGGASISADGRFVAFVSGASDLVPGDGNGDNDIFVRDLVAGTTVRASVDTEGGDPNNYSVRPSISRDGRYVAFESDASDLVAGDGNFDTDVFVRDMVAGTTVRASVDAFGGDANNISDSPWISWGGRYVAFASFASDLVPGDRNASWDVFVRDLAAGTTIRASVDADGGDADGDVSSETVPISGNGRYVAFGSEASDLVSGDGNGLTDIFVRDLVAGTTVRASVDTGGGDPNVGSFEPSISANGRYVAFGSRASNLVPGDGNDAIDVFVRDLVSGTTARASVDSEGGDPNDDSSLPSISATGLFVTFWSPASDLIVGDANGKGDVYLRKMA
jgi:Tol biopolymer transport system component